MHTIRYTKVQIIKYNSWQLSNSYMFWQWSVIIRESARLACWTCISLFLQTFWDDIPVPKHVGVWYMSWIVFYDLYLSVSYCVHLLVDTMIHDISNINFEKCRRWLTLPVFFKFNTCNTECNSYRNMIQEFICWDVALCLFMYSKWGMIRVYVVFIELPNLWYKNISISVQAQRYTAHVAWKHFELITC